MSAAFTCPHCHAPINRDLPVEAIFTVKQASMLLNLPLTRMKHLLRRHAEVPKRYEQDERRRVRRVLFASELRYLQGWHVAVRHRGKLLPLIATYTQEQLNGQYPTIDSTVIGTLCEAARERNATS